MTSAHERARNLTIKAEHDLAIARLGLRHQEAFDMVCFHLQQAVEKLLKALLECGGVEFPPTHNLVTLLDLTEPHYPEVAAFRSTLPDFIPYAVRIRYDEELYPDQEETAAALELAETFRRLAHRLLPPAIVAPEKS